MKLALRNGHRQIRWWWYYPLALVGSMVLFLPWGAPSFVSDDWPLLWRSMNATWSEAPSWFLRMQGGWYRPLFQVYLTAGWQLFATQPYGYRLVAIVLYALIAGNTAVIGLLVTSDGWIALLAAALFLVFAPHSEAVMWTAANNELLMGLFVTIAFIAYVRFRRTGRLTWLLIALFTWILGVLSKEPAIFLPVVFLFYDLLYGADQDQDIDSDAAPSALKRWGPPVFLMVIAVVIGMVRLQNGSVYDNTLDAVNPIKNGIYYFAIGLLAIPSNYVYLASMPLWRNAPLLPLAAALTAILSIGLAIVYWVRSLRDPRCADNWRALLLFGIWSVAALAPVILIIAERTIFLSSIGIVLMLSTLFITALRSAQTGSGQTKGSVADAILLVAMFAYIGMQVGVLQYRNMWWDRSARATEMLLDQLPDELAETDSDLLLVGLPDHLQYAYTFRNAFPSAAWVIGVANDTEVILDSDLSGLSPMERSDWIEQKSENRLVLIYSGAKLEKIHDGPK